MKPNQFVFTLAVLLSISYSATCQSTKTPPSKAYEYNSIPGDPLKARIYTLKNGLKVYLSVYKDEPRFYSMIGVKAGSKTDPADATGLAHYLEHMLFKGTDQYGTKDYTREKILLDSIFALYDAFGKLNDSVQRVNAYKQIDAVSGAASQLAIPNEFDKMMSAMGVEGTNAFTSVEQTVYINDVPSNYLEPFLRVSAERFRKPVMRLFHTELEAVYEEKNRALDNDGRKIYETSNASLFQKHPYGTQTTIGTVEHLKNPSLRKIQEYFEKYYVPDNMVISFSGDFNPDEVIKSIDKQFGTFKPKPIPPFTFKPEDAITVPIVKEVFGPDAESVTMSFRFGGATSNDADMILLVDMVLNNGQAGLFDLNLNQAQKVLSSGSSTNIMRDYSVHTLSGRARDGQTLEQVRDLMIGQLNEIKNGNFPDWLLGAAINQLKLERAKSFESNSGRASFMLSAEINGVNYKDALGQNDRLAKITKQQVMDFVKKSYGENYVIIYKRTGEDKSIVKVVKPQITPIAINREDQTPFLKSIVNADVTAIQPEFIDFNKSINKFKLDCGVEVSYVQNKENNLFDLYYILDMGTNSNKKLGLAIEYLEYLGSQTLTAAQIKQEFYKLGCDYNVLRSEDNCYLQLSGLKENFPAALLLFEEFITNPKPDEEALKNYINDVLKKRQDAKLNKRAILSLMQQYGKYGATNPSTHLLSEQELKELRPVELSNIIKNLTGFEHRINYYGPESQELLSKLLNKYHKVPKDFQALLTPVKFEELKSDVTRVFVFDYDMKQAEISMLSKGDLFNKDLAANVALYNEYFGGSMSSIVFQTLRESKALAYSVNSTIREPQDKYKSYFNFAYIGSQADKLPEAMQGMSELLNDMPLSESGFSQAKDAFLKSIQTQRITKSDILFTRDRYKKLGYDYDRRKDLYDQAQKLSLGDIKNFQELYVKNKKYTIMVLGKKERLDFKALEKYGEVTEMGLENIFGY